MDGHLGSSPERMGHSSRHPAFILRLFESKSVTFPHSISLPWIFLIRVMTRYQSFSRCEGIVSGLDVCPVGFALFTQNLRRTDVVHMPLLLATTLRWYKSINTIVLSTTANL